MTALEIAARILAREHDPQRVAKAKALAQRMGVPWKEVMAALQQHVTTLKDTYGLE